MYKRHKYTNYPDPLHANIKKHHLSDVSLDLDGYLKTKNNWEITNHTFKVFCPFVSTDEADQVHYGI